MYDKGLLIVISGPTASGKGSVNRRVLENPEFAFSVSATTRPIRPGEVDGVNYHFMSKEDFEAKIAAGELLEYTCYCGNYYGTLRSETEAVISSGRNLILEIEVEGAKNIKKKYPDAVLVLIIPPDFKTQEKRLRSRGTETEEKIAQRLARTKEEIPQYDIYDYIVCNEDGKADEAAKAVISIALAEKYSEKRNRTLLENYFN